MVKNIKFYRVRADKSNQPNYDQGDKKHTHNDPWLYEQIHN